MILCHICKNIDGELKFENPGVYQADYPTVILPNRLQFNFYCKCGYKSEFPVKYNPKQTRKVGQ